LMASRSSVKWIALMGVLCTTRGSSVNTLAKTAVAVFAASRVRVQVGVALVQAPRHTLKVAPAGAVA